MKSQIAHNIKHRKIADNDFYTPGKLVKELIKLVPIEKSDIICDNAYGQGVFFNNFPPVYIKQSCDKKKDFLKWHIKQSWFITNPPYSFLDKWLEQSCKYAIKGFAYLFGIHNLTPRRIEMCENKGFYITHIHFCKVFKWFGISSFIIWQKLDKKPKVKLTYDRVVWR